MNTRVSEYQMESRRNKTVVLLCNPVILWALTHDCGVLGFGNDTIHLFLPPYSLFPAPQEHFQERASTFPHFLCQISFPASSEAPCLCWSWWLLLCERAHITALILTGTAGRGVTQLLQGEQRQRACEYSVPTTWAPMRSGARVLWQQSISHSFHTLTLSYSQTLTGRWPELKSHLHLWQETFLSHSVCGPADEGERICLHMRARLRLPRVTAPVCTAWK